MKLGWLNGSQLHVYAGGLDIVELTPIALKGKEIKAVKIPLNEEGSYYLVELRVKVGFDSALPQSGILVTRIRPNAPYVTVVRCADRPLEQALWAPGCVFTRCF